MAHRSISILKGILAQQPRYSQIRGFRTTARNCGGGMLGHRDSPGNTEHTPFDFTEENYKKIEVILAKYPENYKQSGCIPLLDLAQRQNGNFLTLGAMRKVAKILGVPEMKVFETATFYTMFNREKVGKYFIQLCGTTPCMICGSEEIKKTIENHLGIKNGETTKDGLFTLLEVECLGACANAPMVQLNDDFYEMLTPKTTIELLDACTAGSPPKLTKWGSLPMNGQISCEGPQGKTSLFEEPTGPGFMMRTDLEKKVDPASVKEHMHY
jgi:NADH dehydrogenase (ubiquinone) flavoprotein 2